MGTFTTCHRKKPVKTQHATRAPGLRLLLSQKVPSSACSLKQLLNPQYWIKLKKNPTKQTSSQSPSEWPFHILAKDIQPCSCTEAPRRPKCVAMNGLSVTLFARRRLYVVTKLYFNKTDQGIAGRIPFSLLLVWTLSPEIISVDMQGTEAGHGSSS